MSGSRPVRVRTGEGLPLMSWQEEDDRLTDAWPYLGPVWLVANERALPALKPWHTIAERDRGELAVLPGYVLAEDPAVDHDPRTYLGWQPASGLQGCCGVSACSEETRTVDEMGSDAFFPALLLGSPLGYRTEVAYNFWTPRLFGSMVTEAIRGAFEAGMRSVLAAWVPDRRGNDALLAEFEAAGGTSTFWGFDDYLALDAPDWDSHLAGLPAKQRQRVTGDLRRTHASGLTIQRITGNEIRPHVAAIAELTGKNREKNGAGQSPAQISMVLTALLDAGADVRAYLGYQQGRLVGSCVALRKQHRLFAKWAGFDYDQVGERSGIYFAMVLDVPARDAYSERLRYVEFGAGAHEAKRLRGCTSRSVSTTLVLRDQALQPTANDLLRAWGEARRSVFGAAGSAVNLAPTSSGSVSACCSNG